MSRAKGRALWLPDVLRDAGLPVEVVPGWEQRGNDPNEWLARVDHHTASNPRGGARPSLGICTHGRPGVPGPLCNDLLDRNGVFVVVAAGAANHPGVSWIPQRGGIGSGVKYWTLGCEVELSGVGEPFPVDGRQYEHMIRADAAICIYLGLDPSIDVTDHKEIARPVGRKIDVRPYDLPAGRVRVARAMTGHRPTPPAVPPTPGGLTVSEAAAIRAENKAADQKVRTDTMHLVKVAFDALRSESQRADSIIIAWVRDRLGATEADVADLKTAIARIRSGAPYELEAAVDSFVQGQEPGS